ncbi:hypothetical protein ACKXGF_02985 [Alkalibacillus sp. S2W]|uniref:hypothetical protein n=1 Tax=Alkalibacillus sp. S2W TaxID=3386553 RepID=UPI00398D59A6
MKKGLIFLTILTLFILPACDGKNDLSGKTFTISHKAISLIPPDVSREEIDDDDWYKTFLTLEFLNENEFTSTQLGKGTYELDRDDKEFTIRFENNNEHLEIGFNLEESKKDFSKYSAEINNLDFQPPDDNEVSHFQKFYMNINLAMENEYEFIRE